MTVRRVEIRLVSTGGPEVRAELDDIKAKLTGVEGEHRISLGIDNATANAKIDETSAKADEFGQKRETATLAVDDETASTALDRLRIKLEDLDWAARGLKLNPDDHLALLKLDQLQIRLEELSAKAYDPKITVKGVSQAIAEVAALDALMNRISAKTAAVKLPDMAAGNAGFLRTELGTLTTLSSSGRSHDSAQKILGDAEKMLAASDAAASVGPFRSLLGRFFGLGRGGLGGLSGGASDAASAAEGAGGNVFKDALASLGGANNYLTGGLIGGGLGLLGSITPALLPFTAGLGFIGGTGLLDYKKAATVQTQYASLQAALQSAKQSYQLDLASKASASTLARARAQVGMAQSAVSKYHQQNAGPLAFAGAVHNLGNAITPDNSTFKPIANMLNQIAGFINKLQPLLTNLFNASLPSAKTFIGALEQMAKIILPAVTQSLRTLNKSGALKTISQGFVLLAQGIADFFKNFSKQDMRNAAVIFKALMDAAKGVIIGLGYAFSFLAFAFRKLGTDMRLMASFVRKTWDNITHWTSVAWNGIVKFVSRAWNDLFGGTTAFGNKERAFLARIWDTIWRNTVTRVMNGVRDVENWFKRLPGGIMGALSRLPGEMVTLGGHVMQGLWNGLKSVGSSILSWLGNFVNSIPGKFMSLLHINSPSLVMHKIGLSVGEGLALGIDHSSALVHASAGNLAMSVPKSFGSAAASVRGAAGASIRIEAGANESDLVKAIVKALRYDIHAVSGGNVQKHLGWGMA